MSNKKVSQKVATRSAFQKANKARKRVLIAKDVLLQLELKRFTAHSGAWALGVNLKNKSKNAEVCDIYNGKKCQVCALGSIFVSAVEFADKLKVGDLDIQQDTDVGLVQEDLFKYLGQWFEEDQLEAIETAFEMGNGATSHPYSQDFWYKFTSDERDLLEDDANLRMRLIMENIVVNGGTFNWHDRVETDHKITFSTPGYKQ